jgi:predicted transcriptional regulator of viral defense system
MKYEVIKKIKKLLFSLEDVRKILGLKYPSAKVFLSRYVKNGYILRLRRNLFVLKEKFDNLDTQQKFILANFIVSPSYISFTTALSYYGLTTQVQQNFFESVSLYRSKTTEIDDNIFKYSKIKKEFYFGFVKKDNFFIATPEKALVDSLYFMVKGKYKLDLSAVDFSKFDKNIILKILKKYPKKISKAILNLCKI